MQTLETLIRRFDILGPRYTSYPTADRFVDAFGDDDYEQMLRERMLFPRHAHGSLSMYVHIPFCRSVCYYCACNKVVTKQSEKTVRYMQALEAELALHAKLLGFGNKIESVHLGGGTPTYLEDHQLAELMEMIKRYFAFDVHPDNAIEVDPRTVTRDRLAHLYAIGFRRISFGVQDFDDDVQHAVNRVQSAEQIERTMADARQLGFQSINVDLICGLPKQNRTTFEQTINHLVRLRPDRIAVYAYAHLPERFKPQRRINEMEVPPAQERVTMFTNAIHQLAQAGYEYIGMDHFALPNDSLSVAKRNGRLHRNFQGYTSHGDGDLLGIGVSAIGKIGLSYSQNAKDLDGYYAALDQGKFPTVRGIMLTREDVLRRAVINAIMCAGRVDFETINEACLIDFKSHFETELDRLHEHESLGLLTITDSAIEVTPLGRYFLRPIAMVFDEYLKQNQRIAKFSRVL